MTLFFISAALLVALCLVFLLAGLFKTNTLSVDQEAVNITLARERRATLDAALADGSIEQSSYDYERSQLEYDLAADLQLEKKDYSNKKGHVSAAIVVALFVPIAAGALYLHIGNPAAITQDRQTAIGSSVSAQTDASSQSGAQAPALAELLPKLEERLAASPEDIEGWRLLGRSYLSVNEFAKAKNAFEKAVALDNNDVATLAQLAESLAMLGNGDLTGEPTSILERANALDASNEHTLWLLAIARQQAGNHDAALAGFDQLALIAGDNPEAMATIEQMRARSVREMAIGSGGGTDSSSNDPLTGTDKPAMGSTTAGADTPDGKIVSASIVVNVGLTAQVLAAVEASHSVFVYAKASQGPPMPLAVSRHTVGELPLSITLDDSMAMIPDMTLSAFPIVTVGARISASGNPIAQPGDWFVELTDVTLSNTENLSLTINQQVP